MFRPTDGRGEPSVGDGVLAVERSGTSALGVRRPAAGAYNGRLFQLAKETAYAVSACQKSPNGLF